MHGSSFLFPAQLDFLDPWSARDEEHSGEEVFRLIQIRLAAASFEKIFRLGKANCLPANDPKDAKGITNQSG
jgi:hypothetical protein